MIHKNVFNIAAWIGVLLSHLAILVLPFTVNQPYFRTLLFWAPFLYLLFFLANMWFFAVLLTPFTIVWIITMIIYNRTINKTKQVLP